MIFSPGKIIFFFVFTLFLSSCKQNSVSDAFQKIIQKTDEQSLVLKHEVKNKIGEIQNDSLKSIALEYDKLTKDFYDNLNQIIHELPLSENDNFSEIDEVNSLLFEHGKGKRLVETINTYRENILTLTESNRLKEKIKSDLNTETVIDKNGVKADWLEYYFKDFPAIATIAKLKQFQNDALNLENKFIDDLTSKSK